MSLNFKKFGEGEPLIILHGLMGMLDNWQTQAKALSENFEVYLIDQRNHGKSFHSDEHNYSVLAEDLFGFIYENQLHDVNLLGHSMGGKVVMKFAQNNPHLVNKLIVADIAPRHYPVHHQHLLDVLLSINLNGIKRRQEVSELMERNIENKVIVLFLLKNLYWIERGKLAWRFNLKSIKRNISLVSDEIKDKPYDGETLFVGGSNSSYISEPDHVDIKKYFPNSRINMINKAGHWLHADQPKEFLRICTEFLID